MSNRKPNCYYVHFEKPEEANLPAALLEDGDVVSIFPGSFLVSSPLSFSQVSHIFSVAARGDCFICKVTDGRAERFTAKNTSS